MIDLIMARLDALAYPVPILLIATMMLLAAQRLRRLAEAWVGAVGLLAVMGCLALGIWSPAWRDVFFVPERLPMTLVLFLTPLVGWFTSPRDGGTPILSPGLTSRERGEETTTLFERGEGWVAALSLGVVLLLACCLEPPLGPVATEPLTPARLPWFLAGWQEMRWVVRPWLHWLIWPLLFAALWALPYFEPRGDAETEEASRREATRVFLFFAVVLGAVPTAVAVYLRSPQWQPMGLFGPREVEGPTVSLAEAFWQRGLGMATPEAWWWRELPGVLIIVGYGALLFGVLPRWKASQGVFRRYRRHLGEARYRLALVLFLLLGWVPLKLLGRWLFSIGDWLTLPFGWGAL